MQEKMKKQAPVYLEKDSVSTPRIRFCVCMDIK